METDTFVDPDRNDRFPSNERYPIRSNTFSCDEFRWKMRKDKNRSKPFSLRSNETNLPRAKMHHTCGAGPQHTRMIKTLLSEIN